MRFHLFGEGDADLGHFSDADFNVSEKVMPLLENFRFFNVSEKVMLIWDISGRVFNGSRR